MTIFQKNGEIAIGSQIPYTSTFYFCISKKAVAKSWIELYSDGWRVIKAILPEQANAN